MVIPSTPVKVKPMKLNPADLPRLSCNVPPIKAMIAKGKMNVAASRAGSRKNLSTSRLATAAMAFISFTGKDPQVGVLERRRMRAQNRQLGLESAQHLLRGATLETYFKMAGFLEVDLQLAQLRAQLVAVGGIQDQVLLEQLRLDLGRRAKSHDFAVVEDADAVGLLGLVQVVRRQKDGDVVLGPHAPQVLPEVAPAGGVEAGGGLVQEEDPRPVEETTDDLELPLHAARKLLDRPEDVVSHA